MSQLPPKFRQVVVLDPGLVKRTPNGRNQCLENLASLDLHVSEVGLVQHYVVSQNVILIRRFVAFQGVEKHGEMLRLFMQICQAKIPAVR